MMANSLDARKIQDDCDFEDEGNEIVPRADDDETLVNHPTKQDTIFSRTKPEAWQQHPGNVLFKSFLLANVDLSGDGIAKKWESKGGRFLCETGGTFLRLKAPAIQRELQKWRGRIYRYQSCQIIELHDSHIICRSQGIPGRPLNNNPGNKFFNKILMDNAISNLSEESQEETTNRVLRLLEAEECRFVVLDELGWFDLNKEEAHDEVRDALSRAAQLSTSELMDSTGGEDGLHPQGRVRLGPFCSRHPEITLTGRRTLLSCCPHCVEEIQQQVSLRASNMCAEITLPDLVAIPGDRRLKLTTRNAKRTKLLHPPMCTTDSDESEMEDQASRELPPKQENDYAARLVERLWDKFAVDEELKRDHFASEATSSNATSSNELEPELELLRSTQDADTAHKILSRVRDYTCHDVHRGTEIVAMGGIACVIRAMDHHSDSCDVKYTACRVLRNLVRDNPDHRYSVAAAGGIECVINCMKNHSKSVRMQEAGCEVLCYLALDHADNRVSIADAGGVECVMYAIIFALENPFMGLREAGCRALVNLAFDNVENQAVIAQLANKINENGRNALMDASQEGCNSVVRILLESGADVDRKNRNGRSALMFACQSGHESTVQILLDVGADTAGIGTARMTPGSKYRGIVDKLSLHEGLLAGSRVVDLVQLPWSYTTAETATIVPRTAERPELVSLRVRKALQHQSVAASFSQKGREARCTCIDGTVFAVRFFAGRGENDHGVVVEIIPVFLGTDRFAFFRESRVVLDAAEGKPLVEDHTSSSLSCTFGSPREADIGDMSSALRFVRETMSQLDAKALPDNTRCQALINLVRVTEMEGTVPVDSKLRVVTEALLLHPEGVDVLPTLVEATTLDCENSGCIFAMVAVSNCLRNLVEDSANDIRVKDRLVDLREKLYPTLMKHLQSADKNLQLAYQAVRCLEPLLPLSAAQMSVLPDLLEKLVKIGSLRHAALKEQAEKCLPLVRLRRVSVFRPVRGDQKIEFTSSAPGTPQSMPERFFRRSRSLTPTGLVSRFSWTVGCAGSVCSSSSMSNSS